MSADLYQWWQTISEYDRVMLGRAATNRYDIPFAAEWSFQGYECVIKWQGHMLTAGLPALFRAAPPELTAAFRAQHEGTERSAMEDSVQVVLNPE